MGIRPRAVHQRAHAPDGAVQAAEDRLPDQEVTDVQFDDGRNGRDRCHCVEAEAMARMALQPDRFGMRRGKPDAFELMGASGIRFGVAVGSRVQLDHRRSNLNRRIQLGRIGIDEQRNADSGGSCTAQMGMSFVCERRS